MFGPSYLLDKSAFQSLGREAALVFSNYFTQVFPPILAREVLADLVHANPGKGTADDLVAALAGKFLGSGPPMSYDFRTLCISDALGNHVPLRGQIPIVNSRRVPDEGGGYGIMIEPTPTNLRLLAWAKKDFTGDERELAAALRANAWGLSPSGLSKVLDEALVVAPKQNQLAEAPRVARDLLNRPDVARPLLRFLLAEVGAHPQTVNDVVVAWSTSEVPLERFTPYGHHCLCVTLTYVLARRWGLVPSKPDDGDAADLEYLFYLPFARVFTSGDRLHKRLAPLFLRDFQVMVEADELRRDLAERATLGESLDEGLRRRRAATFGMYPYPLKGSIVSKLYFQLLGPWRGGGNRAIELSDDEATLARRESRERWNEYIRELKESGELASIIERYRAS